MNGDAQGTKESRNDSRERRLRWAAIILGTVVLSIGCNPAMLTYFLLPFSDNKAAPQCKLTPKKGCKEVSVVVMANYASFGAMGDFVLVDNELADRVGQALRKRFQDNKEKIKIIPNSHVKSFLNKDPERNFVDKHDIGKHFEADYVIHLEIGQMGLFEKNSYNQLLRGTAEVEVTAFDMSQPKGESKTFETVYRLQFPETGPEDVGVAGAVRFRSLFLDRMGRDISRFFAAYPMDERNQLRGGF
jgi:hypothetical protein